MPEWTAPFHKPHMTTKEFDLMKDKYVAKYGYSVAFPVWNDIIKFGFMKPISVEEEWAWKNKHFEMFGEERLAELAEYKRKRKRQFLVMLGSPTPRVFRDLGAIMTALDDIQDTGAVLCILGKALAWTAPKVFKRYLAGPFGWIFTVYDIMSLIMDIGRGMAFPVPGKRLLKGSMRAILYGPKATTRTGKRQLAEHDKKSPFGKKARIKRLKKLMKLAPTYGNLLEVAQVTGQVTGYGLSLGPIVGFASDLLFGTVRTLAGQTVKYVGPTPKPAVPMPPPIKPLPPGYISYPTAAVPVSLAPAVRPPIYLTQDIPQTSPAYYTAAKTPKAIALLMASGYQFDDETTQQIALANCLAQEELLFEGGGWNALDHLVGVKDTQIQVPAPNNPLTIEAMDETGYPWRETLVWPHNGKPWAKTMDIVEEYPAPCQEWMNQVLKDHADKSDNYLLGDLFTESHFYTLANLEGKDQVVYEYTEPFRFGQLMLELGFYPDPDQPKEKLELLARILEDNEKNDRHLSAREYLDELAQNDIALMSWA